MFLQQPESRYLAGRRMTAWLIMAVGLVTLIAGQFVAMTPFLGVFAVLLWVDVVRVRGWRLVKDWEFWCWVVFVGLVVWQAVNAGSVVELPEGLRITWPARRLGVPFTLFRDRTVLAAVCWVGVAGLSLGRKNEDQGD
jgi:hypothetical protein